MASRSIPSLSKLTAIGLIAATCLLAGCGRKAGLDLPPSASATQQPEEGASAEDLANRNSATNLQSQIYTAPGSSVAVAPKGQKKRIPLDAILD